jgi:TatD DNase family protein
VQRDVFAQQIGLAHRHDLALVIHTRNAWDDTFALLDENGVPSRTVFHCFSGGEPEARRALDIGAYLSFSGIVTFPKADDVRRAAEVCPPDRLLVETDSPYLTPVPHRGTANRPAFVTLVGAAIANLKGEGLARKFAFALRPPVTSLDHARKQPTTAREGRTELWRPKKLRCGSRTSFLDVAWFSPSG